VKIEDEYNSSAWIRAEGPSSSACNGGRRSRDTQSYVQNGHSPSDGKVPHPSKRLKYLTSLLQKEFSLISQLNSTRLEVAQQLTALSSSSPLESICAGDRSKSEADAEALRKNDEIVGISRQTAFGTISVDPTINTTAAIIDHPYLEVHRISNERGTMYAQRFKEHVLKYAAEWEATITIRVTAGLKELDKQRLDLEHYTRKFEALRVSANKLMAGGKTVPIATADKLKRNEMKLLHAKQNYEAYSSSFALLISEVTERCWKDLHPLLVKLIQFDSALAADENKNVSQLNQATSELKKIGVDNTLDPKGRLMSIQTLKPEELFTGDKTNPFGRRLMIEGGQGLPVPSLTTSSSSLSSGMPFTNVSDNEWHSSSSTVPNTSLPASDGGAFYNPFDKSGSLNLSQSNNPFSTSGSINTPSFQSDSFTTAAKPNGLSQIDMLDLAAASAPAPTMSDINEAIDTLAITSNQPTNQWAVGGNAWPAQQPLSSRFPDSTGGKPSIGSSRQSEAFAVPSQQFMNYDTRAVAPAPCGAPPMPPPPPPAFSMYSNGNGSSFGGNSFGHDIFSPPSSSVSTNNLMGGSVGNPLAPERRPSTNPFDSY